MEAFDTNVVVRLMVRDDEEQCTDSALMNHDETLHLWQSRLFGPAWHATYIAWGVGGALGGGAVGLFSLENVVNAAEAGGYASNPFEYYAYAIAHRRSARCIQKLVLAGAHSQM